jgi:hypothetical protein
MSKDKRITLRQAVKEIQTAYDRLERVARQVLEQDFGFTPEQTDRFMERFGERAAAECVRIEADMRRRLGR